MDALRINSYLLALLAAAAITSGCQTAKSREKKLTLIELHMEANPDGTEHTEKVIVNRAAPVDLTINREPFLNTRYLTNAMVVDLPGGFSMQLDFDKEGSWRLESATGLYSGKRVVVLAVFSERRWLAAPLPARRISNGRLTFTPDCTREEADLIVEGLRNTITVLQKK